MVCIIVENVISVSSSEEMGMCSECIVSWFHVLNGLMLLYMKKAKIKALGIFLQDKMKEMHMEICII